MHTEFPVQNTLLHIESLVSQWLDQILSSVGIFIPNTEYP